MRGPLPAELDAALRAGQPTAAQLAAARRLGCTWRELAVLTRTNPSTLAKRVSRSTDPTPPPAIDPRRWLTSAPVRTRTGVSIATLNLWRRAGLFPELWQLSPTKFLYSITDVNRILAAPQYRGHGIDRAAVLAQIASTATSSNYPPRHRSSRRGCCAAPPNYSPCSAHPS